MVAKKDYRPRTAVVLQQRDTGQDKGRPHQHSTSVPKGDTPIVQDQAVLVVLDLATMDFGASLIFLLSSFFFLSFFSHTFFVLFVLLLLLSFHRCDAGSSTRRQHPCGHRGVYCPIGSKKPTRASRGYYTTPLDPPARPDGWAAERRAQSICPHGSWCAAGIKTLCPPGP